MKCIYQWGVLGLLLAVSMAQAKTINVPGDQPTIQDAISVATTGDIVNVAPGTYPENLNFLGKAITVVSESGPNVTIIDGQKIGPVVTFSSGEGLSSVLKGFTLQNGVSTSSSADDGGGVYINGASPVIVKNVIQNNTACDGGAGIAVHFGSPHIQGNTIMNNSQAGCSGGIGGGGISVSGASSAQILNNAIKQNSWGTSGGGISLFAAGTPLVQTNRIESNSAGQQGGGMWVVNASGELLIENVIDDNTALQGAGVYLSAGNSGQLMINNTVANNHGSVEGSALYFTGSAPTVQIMNNIFQGDTGSNALFCESTLGSPPKLAANDAFSPSGTGMGGDCAGEAKKLKNISASPRFIRVGNYKLNAGSPAIDAGLNQAPHLPSADFAGNPRIRDGNGDGKKIVDMGAYEFQIN